MTSSGKREFTVVGEPRNQIDVRYGSGADNNGEAQLGPLLTQSGHIPGLGLHV